MGKPNFIIFYADDLGYGDLGCYGSDSIKTPNLDELAESGVRFTDWYSNSPVCSPSRASLMTGRYPASCGVSQILGGKRGTSGLSSDHVTLAKRLKSDGYKTGLFGKWHLGVSKESSPNTHGFDEFFGILAGCVDYYSHIFYWEQGNGVNPVHDLWENEDEVWHNGEYLTELITEKAVKFIEKTEDEPFFLYVPYNAPHYPMHAPKEFLERYPELPPDRKIMAAMISAMDDGIGSIIKTLKDLNKYEDTVIFFSSDNGPSTESRNFLDGTEDLYYGGSTGKFRGHKASLFEGGIREPAILSYPSLISNGQICNGVGVMMDIVPTFLDIAGVEIPEDHLLDGKSILNMVTKNQQSPHEYICWEYNGQFAIRKESWKLVRNGMLDFSRKQPDKIHLSNLRDDPGERTNLINEYPEIVNDLQKELDNWITSQQIIHHK
ncbi:sulfatase-like hydrolase/transferase [Metabacillus bambusae]|uniref:Sulfatase-like hydrolase/transferase n=1 Tax=Metabacillus bambusae TaxID=2795218 RepID=A0ABS3N758_9BACI|nr:sulfatase-like hydrolase/transferase [Metabacillus bambusae]MBO1514126.1 sulfatase-like hydrolase/transferase [Metabacillus bambusae]